MSLGDYSNLPAGVSGKVNAVEWIKGWEAGAVHVCERLAMGVSLLEVQREVQIILETHRAKPSGHRRPRRRSNRGLSADQMACQDWVVNEPPVALGDDD
jgi:hypothetical protein